MLIWRNLTVAEPKESFQGSNSLQPKKYIENLHDRGGILRNLLALLQNPHPTLTSYFVSFCV